MAKRVRVERPARKSAYTLQFASNQARNGWTDWSRRTETHKPTLQGSARVWFYVEDQVVHLEAVHTAHPNETK